MKVNSVGSVTPASTQVGAIEPGRPPGSAARAARRGTGPGLAAGSPNTATGENSAMNLVRAGFPRRVFAQEEESRSGIEPLAAGPRETSSVFLAGSDVPGTLRLPTHPAHPVIEPMSLIRSLCRLANAPSLARGRDPDRPPHRHKVTETA
ncbi:MAG: hypothetical protein JSR36_00070 [Proteobacteria bacterium]|nr:hypothetical protein [Pseudomonadota bacterium]